MYSRQESARLKQDFWTAFGLYMQPIASAEGEQINWINYRTGEKDMAFRMNVDNVKAEISIELSHKDAVIREIYFEQLLQLKKQLHAALGEDWHWVAHTHDKNGKALSRVYMEKTGVTVFRKEDWPELISFFKSRLLALDAFWSSAKYSFEALR
jgi:hypothetical protein